MRTLTTNAMTAVNTKTGEKPFILLEIQWISTSGVFKYADRDFEDYAGKILKISTVDDIIKIAGGSSSATVSVTLDDIDGTLKAIMDSNDVHKQPCKVYQQFVGLTSSDKFLLMNGEISSPLVWDEGSRQLSFDIITQIEAVEIGFSIEEGQFPLLPISLVGKAWPLAFGSVVNVPALQITSPREGTLLDGFGIHDWSLRRKLQLANAICCPNIAITSYNTQFGSNPSNANANINPNTGVGSDISVAYGGVGGSSPFGNQVIPDMAINTNGSVLNGTSTGSGTGVSSVPVYGPDPNCVKNRCETVERLQFDLSNQMQFEYPSFRVFNGHLFEQNTVITLAIGGAYVVGKFSGDVFTVIQYIHKDAIDKDIHMANNYTDPPTQAQINFLFSQDLSGTRGSVFGDFGAENPADAIAAYQAQRDAGPGDIVSNCAVDGGYIPVTDCESLTLDSLNTYPSGSFQWVGAGAKVTYAYDEEIVYVANILPSTVRCVSAFRTLDDGLKLLLVVPPEYYSVRTTDYGVYQVVEVVMNRQLSLQALGWEDNIYVTLDSSVGPNTVDIIEWLINTYQGSAAEGLGVHTRYSIDATSFAAVRTAIDNYPSSFAYLDRRNIATALDEISMQARCALFIRDNTYYIKYLGITPTTLDTFTEDHVNQNSLQISATRTEEIFTKLVVTWNDDLSLPTKTLIVRNNVNKYSMVEKQLDFYIYNMYSLVQKSALFWLIRYSNTWRRISFTTPLIKMATETYDDVLFNLPDVCNTTFPAQIETATFNPDQNTMTFEAWTPIVSGTRDIYPWAYPGSVRPDQLWPPDAVAQGIGFGVIAPTGHVLSSSTFPENVPDDVTAPNFQIANCLGTPTPNINFCCTDSAVAQPSEFCSSNGPRRVDDANDIKPGPRTLTSCPGAVNLGINPTFAQLQPKFAQIQRQVNQAQSTAASAKAAALNAGGGAGGGGGLGNQDQNQQQTKTDPLSKLPQKKTNTASDPTKPGTCVTTITICWFPIVHGPDGPYSDICFPGGPTRCETHTFGGCLGATQADGSASQAKKMLDLLISKGMDATSYELCGSSDQLGICCNGTVQVITPNCAACAKGASDGQWMNVKKVGQGGTEKSFPSIFFDGNAGDRGEGGHDDAFFGIDAH